MSWRLVGGSLLTRSVQETRTAWALWRSVRPNSVNLPPRPFADWVADYQLTEADLSVLYRRHQGFCYALGLGGLFSLGYGTATVFATFGWGWAIATLLLSGLFLVRAAGHSLRCWQIKERRLSSFTEWLKQPLVWIPSSF